MGHVKGLQCAFKCGCLVVYLIRQVNATEATALVGGFNDASGIRAGGLHINGTKYIALRADDRSIYGKKV